jgi:purine-binding chemotaxis protein CheW
MIASLQLVARIGGCGVLFDAERVDSVVEVGTVVPAPGAAASVIGLAAMRSRVATVLDVRTLLGVARCPDEKRREGGRAVATIVDGHLYAIAVDSLEDVSTFELGAAPAGLDTTGEWDFVTGIGEGQHETLLALDVDRLVARASALT